MIGSVQHLTNSAYGFPRGRHRRVPPIALAVVHITGNSRTAAYADKHAAAQAERDYANRAGSDGPSAHDYVARDGWAIEGLDWKRYAAWSNGDVLEPNILNDGIRRVVAFRDKGYNANEAYWFEFENVGYPTSYPITLAQRQHCAERIAEAARHSGLPINRETVHGHWEINGVNRRNCPVTYADREAFLADVIKRANALMEEEMVQAPITDTTPALIDLSVGATLFDLDGKTVLRRLSIKLTDRYSPYGVGPLRAIFAKVGEGEGIVLAQPSGNIVRPIPAEPVDCAPLIEAARKEAAAAATTAERERVQGIAAQAITTLGGI